MLTRHIHTYSNSQPICVSTHIHHKHIYKTIYIYIYAQGILGQQDSQDYIQRDSGGEGEKIGREGEERRD